MKQVQMTASVRTTLKKNAMYRLRTENVIPAVLYGQGKEASNLQVVEKQLLQLIHTPAGLNVLVKLTIEGGDNPQEETVIVKSLQRHPVTSKILHVDFLKISMDKPLTTSIPVVLTGTARGIKEGGLLEQVHRELTIRCLPSLLPEHFTVDVTNLGIHEAITVSQLEVAEGIEVLVGANEPIVHVVTQRVEEVKAPAEGEAAAATAAAAPAEPKQPEVIGEKEREQRRLDKEKDKK